MIITVNLNIQIMNRYSMRPIKTLKGKKIFVRADGGEGIGMGKLMTALTIARKLQEQGANVFFVTVRHHMWSPLVFEGMPVKILRNCFFQESMVLTDKEIQKFKPDIVILNMTDPDVYQEQKVLSDFPEWIENMRKRGIRVVGIEGHATERYHAHAIINWTSIPSLHHYKRYKDTAYYIGQRYVVLRDNFLKARKRSPKHIAFTCKNAFVSLGGGTEGVERVLFPRIMAALSLAGFKGNVSFMVGAAYKHPEHLKPLLKRWSSTRLFYNIPSKKISALMAQSDIAITAGGITLYELSCLGIPSLLLPIVSHQLLTAKAFERAGVLQKSLALNPSVSDISEKVQKILVSKTLRKTMSNRGKAFIDGRGLERVVEIVKTK